MGSARRPVKPAIFWPAFDEDISIPELLGLPD